MKYIYKKNSGFTLIETLVAISIFTVSIVLLMSVLGNGISDISNVKKKMVAGYLAQEGIEYIRNMRDTYVLYSSNGGWNTFTSKLTSCKLNNNGCGINNSFPPIISTIDNSFIFQCSPKCNLYLNNGSYISSGSVDSGFTRTIRMDNTGLDENKEVKIISTVEWTQKSGIQSVIFSENLFNWVEQ